MLNKNKKIYFSKMHGLGNDFVIIDGIYQEFTLSCKFIQKMSDRYTGIGFDQLLLVEKANNIRYDFYYRIFNADGSEAAQCGNGARCFAYFLYLKKISQKKKNILETKNSNIVIQFINKSNIIVNMGKPLFNEINIPKFKYENFQLTTINFNNDCITFGAIFIGNPHVVIIVNNINDCDINNIGIFFNTHNKFPEGINVNFMQVVSSKHILLRVYERGVGETKACGSGACASVVFGIIQGILHNQVVVTLPGGDLEITWNGFSHSVYMKGPAEHVYDGCINMQFL
ncbi:diaminopimelate epimerase [Buchnera aphidicola]|uniref:Diaminopimelate epimerase n=1 Tax=Buchnera aphidicola (Sarucallis kahawaluokalani) TaxID=1241878 RepID=A0A4D6YKH9_9GAMM|nr:diaminopimelate epimerase [Buchnera aphidicola]QCI26178.1 diaminopimelate epimerase [Buchnera aphidicola (Sarucallis kahawaluokalani)]